MAQQDQGVDGCIKIVAAAIGICFLIWLGVLFFALITPAAMVVFFALLGALIISAKGLPEDKYHSWKGWLERKAASAPAWIQPVRRTPPPIPAQSSQPGYGWNEGAPARLRRLRPDVEFPRGDMCMGFRSSYDNRLCRFECTVEAYKTGNFHPSTGFQEIDETWLCWYDHRGMYVWVRPESADELIYDDDWNYMSEADMERIKKEQEQRRPSPEEIKRAMQAAKERKALRIPSAEELQADLSQEVLGQEYAIREISRLTIGRLAALDTSVSGTMPPLSLLLVGPSGVGKTEVCKQISKFLKARPPEIFNMTEYTDGWKSSSLFGSATGYVGSDKDSALGKAIRERPDVCMLVFDEMEKASKEVFTGMMQLLDEGKFRDTMGDVACPKNTIIFLTSNLEADKIQKLREEMDAALKSADEETAGEARSELARRAKEIIKQSGFFRPEVLNRISRVIVFSKLSDETFMELLFRMTQELGKRYGIAIEITAEAAGELMARAGSFQAAGGRGVKEHLTDMLTDQLLDLQAQRVTEARLVTAGNKLKLERLA